MELIHQLAEAYADRITSADEDLLQKIHAHTLAAHPHAHMISGHVQGRFLSFISQLIQPKYILEIGTFTGYSALCLSEGLTPDGELHKIELRSEDAHTAASNFGLSTKYNQIHLHIGNALEIIPTLNYSWDLVFIDADKTSYQEYYEMVVPRLHTGGLIIADNVLFHGQVLADSIAGKNAKAIDAFNQHVANDDRTEQVLLTIRDGLLLVKKKIK